MSVAQQPPPPPGGGQIEEEQPPRGEVAITGRSSSGGGLAQFIVERRGQARCLKGEKAAEQVPASDSGQNTLSLAPMGHWWFDLPTEGFISELSGSFFSAAFLCLGLLVALL